MLNSWVACFYVAKQVAGNLMLMHKDVLYEDMPSRERPRNPKPTTFEVVSRNKNEVSSVTIISSLTSLSLIQVACCSALSIENRIP